MLCGARGQRGQSPDRALSYMYLKAKYARAAPTAMPRASRANNLATRWRFTYPLCSHTRTDAPLKDTPGPFSKLGHASRASWTSVAG